MKFLFGCWHQACPLFQSVFLLQHILQGNPIGCCLYWRTLCCLLGCQYNIHHCYSPSHNLVRQIMYHFSWSGLFLCRGGLMENLCGRLSLAISLRRMQSVRFLIINVVNIMISSISCMRLGAMRAQWWWLGMLPGEQLHKQQKATYMR